MDLETIIIQLGGWSAQLAKNYIDSQVGPLFFKPYESYSEAAFKMASIVCALFILSLISAVTAVLAMVLFCTALFNLATGHFKHLGEAFIEVAKFVGSSLGVLALALVSPVVNLVDAVGSGIISAKELATETFEENESFAQPPSQ